MRVNLHQALSALIVLSLPVFFIMGCSNDDSDPITGPSGPEPGESSEVIGAAGGDVTYENAGVSIPAGALAGDLTITVAILDTQPTYTEPDSAMQIGAVYEFGPSGTVFNQSVDVEFSYTDGEIGSYDENDLVILTFENEGDVPDTLGNIEVDTVNNTVTGRTNHFSFFVLVVSTSGSVVDPGDYPDPPIGGDPTGYWAFDHLYVPEPFIAMNDSVAITITGTGDGWVDFQPTSNDTGDYEIYIEWLFDISYYSTIGGDTTLAFEMNDVDDKDHHWGDYWYEDATIWFYVEDTADQHPERIGMTYDNLYSVVDDVFYLHMPLAVTGSETAWMYAVFLRSTP